MARPTIKPIAIPNVGIATALRIFQPSKDKFRGHMAPELEFNGF